MRLAIAAFTPDGVVLARRIEALAPRVLGATSVEVFDGSTGFREWFSGQFHAAEALLVIGATGIAVRMLDGLMRGKDKDPAVLVLDDLGQFVIPLLSGHLGGANRLATALATALGAQPVITTATDNHGLFAVDVWAAARGCAIAETGQIKTISAALLRGQELGFYSEFPVKGSLPPGLAPANGQEAGVCLSLDTGLQPFPQTLHLVPRVLVLGAGCRKGTGKARFEAVVLDFLAAGAVSVLALKTVASIDRKCQEPCLLAFAAKYGLDFRVFSASALQAVPGDFASSAFVEARVGVGNVCERAAMAANGPGRLLLPKTSRDGMALALAVRDWQAVFDATF